MPTYRAYPITKDRKIAVAPSIGITCLNDQDGLQQAKLLVDAYDLELWDGPRFIARLKSEPKESK